VELDELSEVVGRLASRYRLYGVVLFGSRARGDWKPWSDYDLLILADFEAGYMDRIAEILELLKDFKIPVEPHPYTLEEAESMLARGNPTIVDALEEGVALYESPELQRLRRIYRELKERGLERTTTSVKLPPRQDEGA